jgi:acyl-coenzyme A thioesterase PaaI-like protein
MLQKLPSAFFCGVRLESIALEKAVVSVPYRWISQNPFKSTYFACLAMAAEMSTGLLSMMHTFKKQPPISMLVVGLEATYHRKATGRTFFTCEDGQALSDLIAQAIATGESYSYKATSTGLDEQGNLVAIFHITWSFKVKGSKA